jgi:outer membrane biogenesis lipoprotein LolB
MEKDMKIFAAMIAALPLAACATTASDAPAIGGDIAMQCNAEAVQNLIGQKATAEIGAQVLKATKSNNLRWGAPGMAWTMDLRSDRVNISYDENMVIERITCG